MKFLRDKINKTNDAIYIVNGGIFTVYKGTFQIDKCMKPLEKEVL